MTRMWTRARVAAVATLFASFGVGSTACTSILGTFEVGDDALGDAAVSGLDASDGLDGDRSEAAADAGSDVVSIPDGPVDPPLPCDASETPADGIFVSATDGNDASGNGTKLLPYKTVASAMTAALATGKKVINLAEGTYPEALSFDATHQGLTVVGGWLRAGDAWTRDCSLGFRSKTIVASPTNVAVRVNNVTQPTALESLTVATKATCASAAGAPGETCIGVLVTGTGSIFRMKTVKVLAGRAGDGGSVSAPAAQGNVPCDGYTGCTASPQTGKVGDGGAGAAPGAFTTAGWTPGEGHGGAPGTNGQNGAPGGPGQVKMCASAGQGQCQSGGDQCVHGASNQGTAPAGKCGCGGLGGLGGVAGHGGGSSVALFVSGAGAKVAIEATSLVAGDGGQGSAGSAGGAPGPGAPGTNGANVSCPADNGPSTSPGPTCGCVGIGTNTANGGPAGGAGAPGGGGGGGTGGAGGASYAQVTASGAQVLTTGPLIQLAYGAPGAGPPGSPAGSAGATFNVP